ncbi:MAG TPA: hypothetical protein VMS71_01080 [Candidatus Acidoferrum sp.]|nr:hypothetical protein [Candidatus Acidoferrum sp.]
MKKLLVLAFLLAAPLVAKAQDFRLFDSAMAQVGMTKEDIRFDQDEMAGWGGDRWRLSYFTMFHKNPFKLPKYGQMNLEAFTADCGNITNLVGNAGRKIDCPVRRGLVSDQLEKFIRKPNDSIPKPSFTRDRNLLVGSQYDRLKDKLDLFFAVINDPDNLLKLGLDPIDKLKLRREAFEYFVSDSEKYNDDMEALGDQVDLNRVLGGAEDIAEVLRRMADSIEYCTFPNFKMEINTRKGLIVIGTKADDLYEYKSPPLLIIDPGGNDTYRISGYPTDFPLTAILDVSGNDKYLSDDSTSPGIGGAIGGMAVVIDKAGDDYYESRNVAQGCGIFGVGVIMDNNGNDRYRMKQYGQGCGIFGAGILSDSVGNDSLYCWSNAQGYGYTKGCGLCINYSGDDVYIAEDSILFSPGQQTKDHNSSLAQGVGFGKRADYIDGHSWAGGVGILCDISGNDKYSAGLFAQGCGYWYAVGMLIDGSGDDYYHSVWYALGSGAHFAVGYFDDFAGNDKYDATMNMSLGSGHDFTIGYFNERGGNDTYNAPGLSLGGGNFQGIGIFHDWSGDDVYNVSSNARYMLGGANGNPQGARAYLNTFGVFIDGGGNDTYNVPFAKNGTRWLGQKSGNDKIAKYEIGVGIDR